MVVFDRVVTADPSFRKYWLLHSLEEPRIESSSTTIDCTLYGGRGRLTLDVLLPPATNSGMVKTGGPGREFWVSGENDANDVEPERLARNSMEAGVWRIELSPKAAAAEDLFLNVMQVTDRDRGERWPVRRIEAAGHVGCVIEGPDASWLVLRPEASISIRTLDIQGQDLTETLITATASQHMPFLRLLSCGTTDKGDFTLQISRGVKLEIVAQRNPPVGLTGGTGYCYYASQVTAGSRIVLVGDARNPHQQPPGSGPRPRRRHVHRRNG